MKLRFVSVIALAFACAGCTKQQATNVLNGIFTADQAACLALNAGLIDLVPPTAAATLEAACNIAPALDQDVQNFINSFGARKAAMQAAAKK